MDGKTISFRVTGRELEQLEWLIEKVNENSTYSWQKKKQTDVIKLCIKEVYDRLLREEEEKTKAAGV